MLLVLIDDIRNVPYPLINLLFEIVLEHPDVHGFGEVGLLHDLSLIKLPVILRNFILHSEVSNCNCVDVPLFVE